MPKITITRTNVPLPDEANLVEIRKFLFLCFAGFTDQDSKRWRRFWKTLVTKEPGEMCDIETVFPRNSKFHAKFFALLTVGFEAWSPERKRKTYKGKYILKNFERFRSDITILAGYYEQVFDIKGRMKLEAKSISFANMEDDEFESLYSAVIDVFLREILKNYKGRAEIDRVIENILGFA